jgi:tight adherence protein B
VRTLRPPLLALGSLGNSARTVGLLTAVLVFATLVLSGSAWGAKLQVTDAGGVVFPERALLLSGQGIPSLKPAEVHVVENGTGVHGLAIRSVNQSAGQAFGVVVVIDVTPSVTSIERAATVAQDLSTLRPAQQEFGLVEADNFPPVVLPMTHDAGAIQRAFSATPRIGRHNLHLWDAALTGVELLASSKISAGSVIVLSDGADRGDPTTLNQLVASAAAAHVRIFTLGISSPHFSPPILRDMAMRTGGEFYQAPYSQVRQIFDRLESRLTSEYLITYYSVQGPGHQIPASIHIDGIAGTYNISYTSPTLTAAQFKHVRRVASFWTSTLALLAVALGCGLLLLLGAAVLIVQRGPRGSVRVRVREFLPSQSPEEAKVETLPITVALFDRTQRVLEGAKWWPRFQEEVDIAQIRRSPIEILFLTLVASVLTGAILFAATGLAIVGIMPVFLGPVVMRMVVRHLMRRQQRFFAQQLGEHLQEVASAMRAGRSFVDALALVTEEASEPTKQEFGRALADERLGVPLDQALTPIARRMDSDEMSQVTLVAALDRSSGASTAEVLERLADTVRENTEIRRELHTLTAQARLSRWILTALPVFLLIIISIGDPSYERPMFHTTLGIVLLVSSVIMVATGSFVMSRMIKIDL